MTNQEAYDKVTGGRQNEYGPSRIGDCFDFSNLLFIVQNRFDDIFQKSVFVDKWLLLQGFESQGTSKPFKRVNLDSQLIHSIPCVRNFLLIIKVNSDRNIISSMIGDDISKL